MACRTSDAAALRALIEKLEEYETIIVYGAEKYSRLAEKYSRLKESVAEHEETVAERLQRMEAGNEENMALLKKLLMLAKDFKDIIDNFHGRYAETLIARLGAAMHRHIGTEF
jgi:hypothetical protein